MSGYASRGMLEMRPMVQYVCTYRISCIILYFNHLLTVFDDDAEPCTLHILAPVYSHIPRFPLVYLPLAPHEAFSRGRRACLTCVRIVPTSHGTSRAGLCLDVRRTSGTSREDLSACSWLNLHVRGTGLRRLRARRTCGVHTWTSDVVPTGSALNRARVLQVFEYVPEPEQLLNVWASEKNDRDAGQAGYPRPAHTCVSLPLGLALDPVARMVRALELRRIHPSCYVASALFDDSDLVQRRTLAVLSSRSISVGLYTS